MAYREKRPLIDDDGEARSLTRAEAKWLVRAADFSGFEATMAFMDERSAFLRAAEQAGIARETFLPFSPNKPGFIERATAALEAAARAGGHAAE